MEVSEYPLAWKLQQKNELVLSRWIEVKPLQYGSNQRSILLSPLFHSCSYAPSARGGYNKCNYTLEKLEKRQ